MSNVTIFYCRYSSKKVADKSIEEVLNSIKKPSTRHKNRILNIRKMVEESKDYETKKAYLPLIMWNGVFVSTKVKDLVEPSNFLYIDIDYKPKFNLSDIPFIYAYWKSVSGRGYGMLVRSSDLSYQNYSATYRKIAAMLQVYGIVVDKQACNINRGNAASYDPDLYINKDAVIVESKKVKINKPKNKPKLKGNYVTLCRGILSNLIKEFGPYRNVTGSGRHGFIHQFLIKSHLTGIEMQDALYFLKSKAIHYYDTERLAEIVYRDSKYKGAAYVDFSQQSGTICQ